MLCKNEEDDLNSQLEALKIELANEKQKSLNLQQELSFLRQKNLQINNPKTPHCSHESLSRRKSDSHVNDGSYRSSVSLAPKLPGNKRDYIQLSEDDDDVDDDDDDVASVCEEHVDENANKEKIENPEKYKVVTQLNSWTNLQKITEHAIIRDVKTGVIETQDDIKNQVKKIDEKLIVEAENMVKPKETIIPPETSKIVFNKISLKSMVEQWDIAFSATITQRELREQPRRIINEKFLSSKSEKVLQIAKISMPKVILSQAEKELINSSFQKWKSIEGEDNNNNSTEKTKLSRTTSKVVFKNFDKDKYETVKREDILKVCQGIGKTISMFQDLFDKQLESDLDSESDEVEEENIEELSSKIQEIKDDIMTADGDIVDENSKIVVRELPKPSENNLESPFAPVPPGAPPPPLALLPSPSKPKLLQNVQVN